MSQLTDALDGLVYRLTQAGITATTDARNITTPGAWVTVHDATPFLGGNLTIRADVCLIVGDLGGPTALTLLVDLLDLAADAIAWDEPARPMTLTPPGVAPLPALVITTTTE